mmetsp:Transcript_9296/g.16428  ORF Transcript_9296/g.16428 Transcript_9296/m.16428 type:complete len:182 (+) Transcript_9296:516-1061(+)
MGAVLVAPVEKKLACGDVGMGAMATPHAIAEAVRHQLQRKKERAGVQEQPTLSAASPCLATGLETAKLAQSLPVPLAAQLELLRPASQQGQCDACVSGKQGQHHDAGVVGQQGSSLQGPGVCQQGEAGSESAMRAQNTPHWLVAAGRQLLKCAPGVGMQLLGMCVVWTVATQQHMRSKSKD